TESQDRRDAEARMEINRRVEFLLIPPALIPAQLTCEAIYKNPNNPIVVCPQNPQPISVTLRFTRDGSRSKSAVETGAAGGSTRRPGAGLTAKITGQGGFTQERTTDAQGQILLPESETTQGDYRVSVVGDFELALRNPSQGRVRNNEVLLHVTQPTTVEIIV